LGFDFSQVCKPGVLNDDLLFKTHKIAFLPYFEFESFVQPRIFIRPNHCIMPGWASSCYIGARSFLLPN